ncbi:hypothetical protein E4P40_14770 [Blastococcus sp. CT_GayMR20]|uniref:hypothetical protein n=1 Tax=Blastococcus sp. CT_GayMR20 TaxID=2559609 RepID=UPI001073BCB9|nr:hypothetical protein [Blastococcus sp. CT_GayMR20]TFV83107.1 hypothetical protein E4P40_14770 [Blastococcus sp. CT_GayMR20]
MYIATLSCGTVLSYETLNLVPAGGELVPCRNHGYCAVSRRAKRATGGRRLGPRAKRRSQEELLEWLQHHPVTTVHALRRQRFTLRMIMAVGIDALLDLDLATGRVVVRSPELLVRAPGEVECQSTRPP